MKRDKLYRMVLVAFFVALIAILGLTPLGLIPLGFIYVTTLCVPVIIGTVLFGWRTGLLLGFAFGCVSFGTALTKPSSLVGLLMAKSPLLVGVMTFLPRLLVPLTTHWAYRAFGKRGREKTGIAVAAVTGSLTNTVFYLGLMLLFFLLTGVDSTPVLGLIGGTGLIAGASEAAVAAILAVPITLALDRLRSRA